jgi:hypothetical protein
MESFRLAHNSRLKEVGFVCRQGRVLKGVDQSTGAFVLKQRGKQRTERQSRRRANLLVVTTEDHVSDNVLGWVMPYPRSSCQPRK